MKPVRTPDTNTVLTLNDRSGNRIPEADLPVERCVDQTGDALWESTWQPDPGEQRALQNGAPIVLHVWGQQHPPVSVKAGQPTERNVAQIEAGHAARAAGALYAALTESAQTMVGAIVNLADAGAIDPIETTIAEHWPDQDAALRLWHKALDATKTMPGDGATIANPATGDMTPEPPPAD